MPAYHSSFNDQEANLLCGLSVLPLKTKIRGPAPQASGSADDIVDETIKFFRANVLFASFEVKGGGDRVLIFLTLYITQCLGLLEKAKSKEDGKKIMFELAKKKFPLPGDAGWLLGGHIPTPKSRKEADDGRKYMEQLREETGMRLVEKVFDGPGAPNKFWIAFSKRKFMNIVHR